MSSFRYPTGRKSSVNLTNCHGVFWGCAVQICRCPWTTLFSSVSCRDPDYKLYTTAVSNLCPKLWKVPWRIDREDNASFRTTKQWAKFLWLWNTATTSFAHMLLTIDRIMHSLFSTTFKIKVKLITFFMSSNICLQLKTSWPGDG